MAFTEALTIFVTIEPTCPFVHSGNVTQLILTLILTAANRHSSEYDKADRVPYPRAELPQRHSPTPHAPRPPGAGTSHRIPGVSFVIGFLHIWRGMPSLDAAAGAQPRAVPEESGTHLRFHEHPNRPSARGLVIAPTLRRRAVDNAPASTVRFTSDRK